MATTADKIVRNWWNKFGDFHLMSIENQRSQGIRLNGFLDACVQFGHITETEAGKLYRTLTKE